jgi:TrpR-related protein YerC/YecD
MSNTPIPSKNLYEIIPLIQNAQEAKKFLADLCTPTEIRALCERWKVAQYLAQDELSYREIYTLTGASLTTIGRVARSLREESHQGYKKMLDKIKSSSTK